MYFTSFRHFKIAPTISRHLPIIKITSSIRGINQEFLRLNGHLATVLYILIFRLCQFNKQVTVFCTYLPIRTRTKTLVRINEGGSNKIRDISPPLKGGYLIDSVLSGSKYLLIKWKKHTHTHIYTRTPSLYYSSIRNYLF